MRLEPVRLKVFGKHGQETGTPQEMLRETLREDYEISNEESGDAKGGVGSDPGENTKGNLGTELIRVSDSTSSLEWIPGACMELVVCERRPDFGGNGN